MTAIRDDPRGSEQPLEQVAWAPLIGLALAFAALEVGSAWIGPYGLFQDELYYWACAKRPGLGYVDHPPLAPWILGLSTSLLGDGRLAFGLAPALCAAGTVLLTGLMAQRLGAQWLGQLVAGLCVAVAPVSLILFSFFSVNAFELICWTAACFLVVELIRTRDQRFWLGVGLVGGLGLLNKHTFTLLAFGLAIGFVATPLRAHLRSGWLWLGSAAALLIAFPNLYWNAVNGWPSLAFYRSRPAMDLPASFVEAFVLQIAAANPATVFVWVPGLLFLLFSRAARPYRPLGIAFLTLLLVILFSGQRRADRIAGVYPVVFAAGAAFWDQRRLWWQRGIRWVLPVVLLGCGALAVPATLPLLPPDRVTRYFEAIGQSPEIEAVDAGQKIPLYLLGRLELDRFADDVATALETLPIEERARAVVLTPHWVYASMIEYYARERRLPPVVSPHNAYYFWRRDAVGRDVTISLAIDPVVLARYFSETRQIGMYRCVYCAPGRRDTAIHVSFGSRRPIEELLVEWRYFGIEPAPQLLPDGWR